MGLAERTESISHQASIIVSESATMKFAYLQFPFATPGRRMTDSDHFLGIIYQEVMEPSEGGILIEANGVILGVSDRDCATFVPLE